MSEDQGLNDLYPGEEYLFEEEPLLGDRITRTLSRLGREPRSDCGCNKRRLWLNALDKSVRERINPK